MEQQACGSPWQDRSVLLPVISLKIVMKQEGKQVSASNVYASE